MDNFKETNETFIINAISLKHLNTVSLLFKEMCKGPTHGITDKIAG